MTTEFGLQRLDVEDNGHGFSGAIVLQEIAAGLYLHGGRPHGNCYWVEPGRLMAGEYPGDLSSAKAGNKVQRTLAAGVTCFIDLTESVEGLEPYTQLLPQSSPGGKTIQHLAFPVRDQSVPAVELMKKILGSIERALQEGQVVYVHCLGGVGRTGTVIGCWLRRQGMTGQAALDKIPHLWGMVTEDKRNRRPESPEFQCQKTFVRNWHEYPQDTK